MGISTFFLLGVLVMHRDIERTLNITIFQELLKITKKKKKKRKKKYKKKSLSWFHIQRWVSLDLVWCADETDSGCVLSRCPLDTLVMIAIFVPLASSSCHSLLP
jgi:hypothetical protein